MVSGHLPYGLQKRLNQVRFVHYEQGVPSDEFGVNRSRFGAAPVAAKKKAGANLIDRANTERWQVRRHRPQRVPSQAAAQTADVERLHVPVESFKRCSSVLQDTC